MRPPAPTPKKFADLICLDALACILLERNHWAVTDIEHVFLSITQTFDFRGGSTKLELSIAHKPPLDVVLDLQSEDIVRFSSEERSDVFSRPNAFFEILEVFVLDQKIGEPCFPCDGCQSCNV